MISPAAAEKTFSGAGVRHAERSISFFVSPRIHSEARRLMTTSAERSVPHPDYDAGCSVGAAGTACRFFASSDRRRSSAATITSTSKATNPPT